jgi:hypothetical protein
MPRELKMPKGCRLADDEPTVVAIIGAEHCRIAPESILRLINQALKVARDDLASKRE